MENKTKLTIGAMITLAMLIGSTATYFVSQDDDAYYCSSKDIVMICDKLSSGLGTRCYFGESYKVCSEGWEKLETGQEIIEEIPVNPVVPKPTEGSKWLCSHDGCVGI